MRSSRAGPVNSTKLIRGGLEELFAAEHPLQLVAALGVVEQLDARARRVAGHLLDAEVALGEARDLRQVRDRDDLGALGQALERAADGVRGLAADARVELVEDERRAARDRGDGERDPRELAARGRLGDRRRGSPGFGRTRKRDRVRAAR